VSATLSSLHLDVSKYTRNRRGLPGPASFDWLPVFPNLSSLFLDFKWSIAENWELVRWAPNLKELILRFPKWADEGVKTDIARVLNYVGDPRVNQLPESLKYFKLFGSTNGLYPSLRNSWVRKLTSLTIQYPTKVDGESLDRMMYQQDFVIPGLLNVLSGLDSLEHLALELSSISRADYWNPYGSGSRQFHVMSVVSKMKRLKTLKWSHTNPRGQIESSHEKASIKELMKSFSSLERLHISGEMTGWQDAARQGAFSQVKELLVLVANCGGAGQYLPKGGPCLTNLEHLIVDFSIIYWATESNQLDEKNQNKATEFAEFAKHMKKLKKVTILRGTPFYDIGNISHIITWLRNLMSQTGKAIAVDIEGEEYVSQLRYCLQSQGVAVGAADAEIAGTARVWKEWESKAMDEAVQHYEDHMYDYDW